MKNGQGCVFEGADNWKLYCWHPKQWRPINPMTEQSFVITINFCLQGAVNIRTQVCYNNQHQLLSAASVNIETQVLNLCTWFHLEEWHIILFCDNVIRDVG